MGYFPDITKNEADALGPLGCVKASLAKWEKILKFATNDDFPPDFDRHDWSAEVCHCCAYWNCRKRDSICPLEPNGTHCRDTCHDTWYDADEHLLGVVCVSEPPDPQYIQPLVDELRAAVAKMEARNA